MTGIEPSEDVSIKPVRGKFTEKHVSEPNTENDAERLPSPNYKWHVANGTDLSVDLILAMEAGGHSKVRGWRELFTKATERDSTSWNDFNWVPFYSWLILCVLVFTDIIYQKSSTRRAFKLNIYHFHLEIFFCIKASRRKGAMHHLLDQWPLPWQLFQLLFDGGRPKQWIGAWKSFFWKAC